MARLTEQLVIMAEGKVADQVRAAGRTYEFSDAEICRQAITAGLPNVLRRLAREHPEMAAHFDARLVDVRQAREDKEKAANASPTS